MDEFDPERARLVRRTLIIISVLIPIGATAAAFLGAWAAAWLGCEATGQAITGGAGIALVACLGFWSLLSIHNRWESRVGKATAEQYRQSLQQHRPSWRTAVGGGLGAIFLGGWLSERLGYGATIGIAVGLALAAGFNGWLAYHKETTAA
jgi:hypothetical protein